MGGTLGVVLFLGATSGLVYGTSAVFNATVGKTGNLAATALAVPVAAAGATFTALASDNNVVLSWSSYTPPVPVSPDPGVTGFAIFRAQSANGTDCTTTTFGTVPLTTLAAAAVTFTDSNVTATFSTGTRVCYALATAWKAPGQASPTWFSGSSASQINPTASARVGFFAIALDFGDGSTTSAACTAACQVNSKDGIRITFNQATNSSATLPPGLCAVAATNTIYIGSAFAAGVCPTTGQVGVLSGGTIALGGADESWNSGYFWNNNGSCNTGGTAGSVLCVEFQSNGSPTVKPAISGTWQLTMGGTSTIKTLDLTVNVCSGAAANCQPTAPVNHNP